MAPRAPAKGAGRCGATVDPSPTLMAPPETPAVSTMCLRTRSASVCPRTMTPQEFDENFWTPTPAAATKDSHTPQNIAELIVMNRDIVQNTIEGQSISPIEAVSNKQNESRRAPSKSRTLSSGVTKSANKGRKGTPGARNKPSPSTTPRTTTSASRNLAAMLDELREDGRKTEAATKLCEVALKENITAGKEAKDAVRKVKKLTLAARKEAIKVAERANRERDEALETAKEAWRIGERYR